ncbi:hypothetical protein SV7mr_42620 [Stieleria bergensis]|uniref:Uncharacterized protein n=1 Tax=Stieleria bergensis TaxID=2528025 RepID=A0A517T070_9BACT|nr:hypothetical protein SV7mr_42620 [Planctomycetes bacterium SV_7m_r]
MGVACWKQMTLPIWQCAVCSKIVSKAGWVRSHNQKLRAAFQDLFLGRSMFRGIEDIGAVRSGLMLSEL